MSGPPPAPARDRPMETVAFREQADRAVALLRDAVAGRGARFALIVAMAIATASLESLALVTLPALLGSGRPDWLPLGPAGLAVVYLALVGAGAGLLYAQTVAATALTLDFSDRLRRRLHEAALGARWASEALKRPSDLVHALVGETAQCAFATQVAINLAARLVYLPALAVAAFVLSPGLALAALLLAGLGGLPMLALARRAYGLASEMARVARGQHAAFADEFAGLKVVKILRAERARKDALRERLAQVRRASLAQTKATAATKSWQRFAAAAAALAGAWYGFAVLRLDGAAMLALALALARLGSSIGQVLELWRQLGRVLPAYGQLRANEERCRAAREPDPAATVPRLRQALELSGVAFRYEAGHPPVFSDLGLTLPARSITVLTGPSGGGKSTVADLAMGLVAPAAGEIRIDGRPLDEPARMAWRARVAYAPQEPYLFHDTIRANLLLARPDASDDDCRRALDLAAADFVARLPAGLDTVVGERGGALSGGERQRLTLARVFLRDADLIVLDEATNALDPSSEATVIESLRRLSGTTTVLAIAHRSALIDAADRVLALENGAVRIERGRRPGTTSDAS